MGEGEGGMIWENGIEICIISCMKQVASPGSMHDTGCFWLVHWYDPEGGYGEGHSFLIHSPADGHLGCFHVLAIINTPGVCFRCDQHYHFFEVIKLL